MILPCIHYRDTQAPLTDLVAGIFDKPFLKTAATLHVLTVVFLVVELYLYIIKQNLLKIADHDVDYSLMTFLLIKRFTLMRH